MRGGEGVVWPQPFSALFSLCLSVFFPRLSAIGPIGAVRMHTGPDAPARRVTSLVGVKQGPQSPASLFSFVFLPPPPFLPSSTLAMRTGVLLSATAAVLWAHAVLGAPGMVFPGTPPGVPDSYDCSVRLDAYAFALKTQPWRAQSRCCWTPFAHAPKALGEGEGEGERRGEGEARRKQKAFHRPSLPLSCTLSDTLELWSTTPATAFPTAASPSKGRFRRPPLPSASPSDGPTSITLMPAFPLSPLLLVALALPLPSPHLAPTSAFLPPGPPRPPIQAPRCPRFPDLPGLAALPRPDPRPRFLSQCSGGAPGIRSVFDALQLEACEETPPPLNAGAWVPPVYPTPTTTPCLYVDASRNTSGSGSKEAPFATLREVRQMRAGPPRAWRFDEERRSARWTHTDERRSLATHCSGTAPPPTLSSSPSPRP